MPARDLYHEQCKNALIKIGKLLLEDYKIPLIVFDVKTEELIKWIE